MSRWLHALGKAFFTVIFAVFYRWDVRGRENVPREGPVLLCANHFDWWDPLLVGTAASRPVFFMAKEELFRYPVLGTLLPKVGAFPVRRGTPDRRALRAALELLAQGQVVGIFPEGTRSRDGRLLPAQPGAAMLAVRSRAPVVPVAIAGPYRLFRPIRVRFGEPFELTEYYDRRLSNDALLEAGARIMERIRRLLPPEQGGAAE